MAKPQAAGLQQVHVRVNDAATGKPTPCRVRFTDGEGKYYAPHGRLTEFAVGPGVDVGGNLQTAEVTGDGKFVDTQFAYIDGACEIALPPGLIDVAISKGPEYTPFRQQIQVAPGKLALRFVLERWSDLRQQGWHPGDISCHDLSPWAAVLDGAGEDLAVVNVLAQMTQVQDPDKYDRYLGVHNSRTAIANLLEFSGQQPALERDGCIVVVNTRNTHPKLGSLALLNCHRVVYPLRFGEPFDNWTLADWCDQCHRKNGLVVWTHTSMSDRNGGEALADVILGKVDAIDGELGPGYFASWYDLLGTGFRVPLACGSGKDSNSLPLGCARTYARLQPEQALTYKHWIEAVRTGRTFATNGPLLLLTVDGQDPGATIQTGADQPVRVCAEARSLVPFEHLEVVVNGKVEAQQATGSTPGLAKIEIEIRIPEGGWLAARCLGKGWLPGYYDGQRVYAHTSPVYLRVAGRRPPVDPAAVRTLLGHLDSTLAWVTSEGRFENDAQRERLAGVFHEARRVLEGKLAAT